ncbi:MAG: sigma-70 family RNA polymerase sigma factor [Dehalococcoidia bacterium]|nr:sigma-70 family RNA polymerase sigma factor [Dehalococcoidia bacterium]
MQTTLRQLHRRPGLEERNRLITENTGLVGYVVGRMAARDSVDPEELYSWGMEGLIQAASAFDDSRGISFATFAIHRIRGRILDALRKADPLPRPLRTQVKRAGQARVDLTQSLGREPTRIEMADELGVSAHALTRIEEAAAASFVSLDRMTSPSDGGDHARFDVDDQDQTVDPLARAERADLARRLRSAIGTLSERQRLVLQRCYVDEDPLSRIGDVLGVSASRVSQIHREAVLLLRARLADEEAPEAA